MSAALLLDDLEERMTTALVVGSEPSLSDNEFLDLTLDYEGWAEMRDELEGLL